MQLHKTELARAMLARTGPELNQAQRRVLILCDGKRSLETIVKMLGTEALSQIDGLIRTGFLTAGAQAPALMPVQPAPGLDMLGRLGAGLRAAREAIQTLDAPVPAPAVATPPPPVPVTAVPVSNVPAPVAPRAGSRRSMAASKMYMIDMLQLQRDMQASSIAVALQTSREDGDLIEAFVDGLAFLHASTKQTVSSRVAERLLETIPEEHLPFMQGVWTRLAGNAPDAANVIRLDTRESRVA